MKNCILVVFLFVSLLGFSQENSGVEKSQFKINMLAPGISYEHGLSEKSTLLGELGTGFLYTSEGGESFSVFPYVSAQYRHYYNFEKRAKKGKNTLNNSANYITFITNVSSGKAIIGKRDYISDVYFGIGPAWGIQRTYKSGFNLDLNLGVGYGFGNNEKGKFIPMLNLTLGWVINRKK